MAPLSPAIQFCDEPEHNHNPSPPPPRAPTPYSERNAGLIDERDLTNYLGLNIRSDDSESSRSSSSSSSSSCSISYASSTNLVPAATESACPFAPPPLWVGLWRITWNALRRRSRTRFMVMGQEAKQYLRKKQKEDEENPFYWGAHMGWSRKYSREYVPEWR
jgi:hypothetical protein